MSEAHHHCLAPTRARSGMDPLLPFLDSALAAPVTISARDVQRIDSVRLHILLSAQKRWARDGQPFRIVDMTPTFRIGLERLGVPADQFDKDAQQ
ncbi:STAS domain-containing protein [Thalassococcus sp. CAU 1522]|uniref:STAS domain-containing protein n=1 Tax=Thalassococcus arenae TaxID=2851652 RepID=A0ABS6N4M2_9RHOB|nr:STAS domain-containing protein [Thalassococcus arenae]MBV2358607.1 STAS domain-containing protein [Thalassococcus arenae]